MTGKISFLEELTARLEYLLPGQQAQFKMAPFERVLKSRVPENFVPKQSATLTLFYLIEEKPHFTLILRNSYKGVHSAQIGFPGGKKEETDVDLRATALRETEEEIGVNKNSIQVIGKLSEVYIPPSGFLVSPYVGYIDKYPHFNPDSREVQRIIEVSVEDLLNENCVSEKEVFVNAIGNSMRYPCFDFKGEIVWGATAMMLSELKEILKR